MRRRTNVGRATRRLSASIWWVARWTRVRALPCPSSTSHFRRLRPRLLFHRRTLVAVLASPARRLALPTPTSATLVRTRTRRTVSEIKWWRAADPEAAVLETCLGTTPSFHCLPLLSTCRMTGAPVRQSTACPSFRKGSSARTAAGLAPCLVAGRRLFMRSCTSSWSKRCALMA